MEYKNGLIEENIKENGTKIKCGDMENMSGQMLKYFKGNYENNLKNGYGVLIWDQNKKYYGYWKNGK